MRVKTAKYIAFSSPSVCGWFLESMRGPKIAVLFIYLEKNFTGVTTAFACFAITCVLNKAGSTADLSFPKVSQQEHDNFDLINMMLFTRYANTNPKRACEPKTDLAPFHSLKNAIKCTQPDCASISGDFSGDVETGRLLIATSRLGNILNHSVISYCSFGSTDIDGTRRQARDDVIYAAELIRGEASLSSQPAF